MHKFNENHSEFKGFSEHYATNIFPHLDAADDRRKNSLMKVGFACIGVAVLTIIASIIWYKYIDQDFAKTALFAVAVGGLGMFSTAKYFLKEIKSDTKLHLAGGICNFIGWHFSEKVFIDPKLDTWTTNGLLPKTYHRVNFEDQMQGKAHGASFLAMEAHLEKEVRTGKNKNWVTTFMGTLMFIEFDRKFLGRTVVRRNNILHNKKKFEGMKKVGLVDPVFEKIFQAYGTDQVEARYLLTPDFMQRLVDLETSVEGKRIRFAFINKTLMIAVETKNCFEAGSMLKPLTTPSKAQNILDEIGAVYDVIDGVLKPQKLS